MPDPMSTIAPRRHPLPTRMGRIRQRDIVPGAWSDEQTAWFEKAERLLTSRASERDPRFDLFPDWYQEHFRRFGPRVRPGLLALYWIWSEPDVVYHDDLVLDWQAFKVRLRYLNSPTVPMLEFYWWAGGLGAYQGYVMEAINCYREMYASGDILRWHRRKRRKVLAARRALERARAETMAEENREAPRIASEG